MTAAACEAARARVGQARASLDVARVAVGKTVLRAPFDGVVAELSTEEGEWVTPSPPGLPIPPVLELFDPEDTYVSAPLDEVDVGRVKTGPSSGSPSTPTRGGRSRGKVTRVADYVLDLREQNRTFEVEVKLDDAAFAADAPARDLGRRRRRPRAQGRRPPGPGATRSSRGKVLLLSEGAARVRAGRRRASGAAEWAEVLSGLAAGDSVVDVARPGRGEGGGPGAGRGGAVIELTGVSRTWEVGGRPVHALRDVTLSIAAGEYVAVMGPSGSGKSTLLSAPRRSRPADGGLVPLRRARGRALPDDELSRLRRDRIGFVFQSFHLVPRMTALENVALPIVLAGVPPAERARAGRGGARLGRPRGAERPPPRPALGRREAARLPRARRRHAARPHPRRRADREPRQRLGGGDRRAPRAAPRRRADAPRRHARPGDRGRARRRKVRLADGRVVGGRTGVRGGDLLALRRGGAPRAPAPDLALAPRRRDRRRGRHPPDEPRRGGARLRDGRVRPPRDEPRHRPAGEDGDDRGSCRRSAGCRTT